MTTDPKTPGWRIGHDQPDGLAEGAAPRTAFTEDLATAMDAFARARWDRHLSGDEYIDFFNKIVAAARAALDGDER